jgi:hypothetical protein
MTTAKPTTAQDERRSGTRTPLEGSVTVFFDEQQVIGPGQNISAEGVFFIADAALKVRVKIDGANEWRNAEVVRVQSMGEGRLGMAVRFV